MEAKYYADGEDAYDMRKPFKPDSKDQKAKEKQLEQQSQSKDSTKRSETAARLAEKAAARKEATPEKETAASETSSADAPQQPPNTASSPQGEAKALQALASQLRSQQKLTTSRATLQQRLALQTMFHLHMMWTEPVPIARNHQPCCVAESCFAADITSFHL